MTDIQKAILRTIAYHDVLDMALTPFEVWAYLVGGSVIAAELSDVMEAIAALEEKGLLMQKRGFVMFADREQLAQHRLETLNETDMKFKKTRWAFRILRFVPFVQVVFASGSMALGNSVADSDVDVLIVLKGGRIWTGRFLVTALLHMLGARRHGKRIANRVCLNHFVIDSAPAIPFRTMYTARLYTSVVPLIVNDKNAEQHFFDENSWMFDFLSAASRKLVPPVSVRTLSDDGITRLVRRFLEFLLGGAGGNGVEWFLRAIQQRHIRINPLTASRQGHVVANDSMMSFHPESREGRLLTAYRERLAVVGVEETG